ncbi:hypothetical protein D3C81_1650030 [compost metagenome]
MLRSLLNSIVMLELPSVLDELMTVTPGIVANCFSSCVATEAAMVSGLAPGSVAVTWITGELKLGSAAMGIVGYSTMPVTMTARHSSTVMTGRRIQSSDSVMV